MKFKTFSIVILVLMLMFVSTAALARKPDCAPNSTVAPGFCNDKYDQDDNGYPDEGVTVTGKYTSIYAYDDNGDWYWDLGDGRIQGTVVNLEGLEYATVTVCAYQVQYRGNFENDSFLNSGWIKNDIHCAGYDDNGTYNYLIVHETDSRYTGDPDLAIWGTWEYHVETESRVGNLARPEKAP